MNRKKLILAAAACLAFVVLLISRFEIRKKSRINDDTIKMIQVGMTRQEVESILGEATGPYISSDVSYLGAPSSLQWREPEYWGSYEAQAEIHFDKKAERVESVFAHLRFESKETLWAKLQRWIGL
jgi:hypothetical protein